MNLGPPVRHLLVDLDGTLLGNKNIPLSVDFVTQAMRVLLGHVGWRQAARTLLSIAREFNRPSREHTNAQRAIELFARGLGLPFEEGRKILREALLVIFPGLERHFFPVPGSKEFLDWAQSRYPMVLATNPVWPREVVELRVKWAGIDPSIFTTITTATEMHACKPTREYYEEILALQKLRAEDCLLIGDNVRMDLPASRYGIRVFIVGPYKRAESVRISKGKAPAWRGSYADLRRALDGQSQSGLVPA